MEEVTHVSHFVGSSGKESKRERGGGEVRPLVERVILPTSSWLERRPPAEVMTFDNKHYQGWRNRYSHTSWTETWVRISTRFFEAVADMTHWRLRRWYDGFWHSESRQRKSVKDSANEAMTKHVGCLRNRKNCSSSSTLWKNFHFLTARFSL